MPKFMDWINPFSKKNPYMKKTASFFEGSPEVHENVSNLLPNQQGLQQQQVDAANGGFQAASDYHKSNLSDNPADFNAFAAPQLRQFNEEIIPGLSEQFAGMGAGGLSSSGFRNAAVSAGTDLSERLGAIRANLRQNSANSLAQMSQNALGNYSQDRKTEEGSGGFLEAAAPLAGAALAAYVGGPGAAPAGYAGGQYVANKFGGNSVGRNSGPYGNGSGPRASPQRSV